MKRIEMLGSSMHSTTMDKTVSYIENKISNNEFTQHAVVNVAKLVNMRNDDELAKSVEACDVVNIDGMGVVWGARLCGHHVPERVSGIDIFHNLLLMSSKRDFPIFLLGAEEDIVTKAADVVNTQHPNLNVAGYHHGYFWDDEEAVVKKIKQSGAKLLFVAITSPKKENFINKWQDELGVDFVMGVGGTFDVIAGKVKRAPKWMQNNGLEWLYRVIQEPGRMWKRYLITNSVYIYLILKEKFMTRYTPQKTYSDEEVQSTSEA